jgi:hypothetical protein
MVVMKSILKLFLKKTVELPLFFKTIVELPLFLNKTVELPLFFKTIVELPLFFKTTVELPLFFNNTVELPLHSIPASAGTRPWVQLTLAVMDSAWLQVPSPQQSKRSKTSPPCIRRPSCWPILPGLS